MTPRSPMARALLVALVALPAAAFAACEMPTLAGANIAGGEFNSGNPQATHTRDYIFPAAAEFDLMKRLKLKLIRVPFSWERLQKTAGGPLDAAELARLDTVVDGASARGLKTILDPHNYGTYRGVKLDGQPGTAATLADLWRRLALHFGGNPDVVFGLMNEPHDIPVEGWASVARAALEAVRTTGARNVVLVPGTNWDGAHGWLASGGGKSNADALLPLAKGDPNVVFEVHQYFDDNFSGTAETCGAASRVPGILKEVGAWGRTHRVRLFLGEFGVSKRPECVAALGAALTTIEADADVWYGWTYWAAGAWWGAYPFNLQADNGDTPQGGVLKKRAEALDARCR